MIRSGKNAFSPEHHTPYFTFSEVRVDIQSEGPLNISGPPEFPGVHTALFEIRHSCFDFSYYGIAKTNSFTAWKFRSIATGPEIVWSLSHIQGVS